MIMIVSRVHKSPTFNYLIIIKRLHTSLSLSLSAKPCRLCSQLRGHNERVEEFTPTLKVHGP